MTEIWETCFFMTAYKTVLWRMHGAETGIETQCRHVIQSRELNSGRFSSFSVHMLKISAFIFLNVLDFLKHYSYSVTQNTFLIYNI